MMHGQPVIKICRVLFQE